MPIHQQALRTYAVTLILSLSLVAPAVAKTPPASAPVPIYNFGQVDATYFRGAQPHGQDFASLAGMGVKLVIDLAREGDPSEGPNAERAGMKFVRIPLTTGTGPSQSAIDQFLGLVNDPANQPVYVHCIEGRHRTGAMTAVYRMTTDGWSADQAFKEMKQYKFGADFLHPQLKSFVYNFFAQLDRAKSVRKQAAIPQAVS